MLAPSDGGVARRTCSRTPTTTVARRASPGARASRIAPGDYVVVPVELTRRVRPAPELPGERRRRRARACRRSPRGVLAIDGPAALPGNASLAALPGRRAVDVRDSLPAVGRGRAPHRRRDRRPGLPARSADGELADSSASCRASRPTRSCSVPAAALVPHDELWYADVPKRHALAAMRRGEAPNVGQRAGRAARAAAALRRLAAAGPPQAGAPRRASTATSTSREPDAPPPPRRRRAPPDAGRARTPARSARCRRSSPARGAASGCASELGIETDAPNLAWSYELIAPEASILRRRPRGRLRAADGGQPARRSSAPRSPRASAARSRSASTTSTRSTAATSRSSATRRRSTRARRSACRTRRTRPTTSMRDDARRRRLPRPARRRRRRRVRARRAGRARRPRVRARAVPAGARRRAAPALPDPGRHAARERRRQRRARDQRDAVPLHASLLRLAAARPRRHACGRCTSSTRSRTSTRAARRGSRRDLIQEPARRALRATAGRSSTSAACPSSSTPSTASTSTTRSRTTRRALPRAQPRRGRRDRGRDRRAARRSRSRTRRRSSSRPRSGRTGSGA